MRIGSKKAGERASGRAAFSYCPLLPAIARSRAPQRGFTLMELLVVLGIVSTVVVSAADIFMLTGRSQRKIFSLERTQADARYTMETIAREVRNGQVRYAHYAGGTVSSPSEELALLDSTNKEVWFHKSVPADESACPDPASIPCLLVTVDGSAPAALTPQGVMVRNVKFYVSPAIDPFVFDPVTGTYAADGQPRVTIVLVLESTGARVGEQGSIVYSQTTVTSRVYRR